MPNTRSTRSARAASPFRARLRLRQPIRGRVAELPAGRVGRRRVRGAFPVSGRGAHDRRRLAERRGVECQWNPRGGRARRRRSDLAQRGGPAHAAGAHRVRGRPHRRRRPDATRGRRPRRLRLSSWALAIRPTACPPRATATSCPCRGSPGPALGRHGRRASRFQRTAGRCADPDEDLVAARRRQLPGRARRTPSIRMSRIFSKRDHGWWRLRRRPLLRGGRRAAAADGRLLIEGLPRTVVRAAHRKRSGLRGRRDGQPFCAVDRAARARADHRRLHGAFSSGAALLLPDRRR